MANAQKPESTELLPFRPLDWYRLVENPVFTTEFGNNHDSVLFVEPDQEYPYYLIVSHNRNKAQLWRSKKFSWSSEHWQLVDSKYKIGAHYEYDDG
ncbi:MAG: hypothetical protein ACSHX0_12060 [Akkermansiaceae bacterium]